MRGRLRAALRGTVLIVAGWWALSLAVGGRVIPAPPEVLVASWALLGRGLALHALATLARTVAAIAAATITAVPAAVVMGRRRVADEVFGPAAYLLYPVPKIAFLPAAFLLFGLGNLTRVFIVALVLFFPILITVRDAVRTLDEGYFTSIRSLGARPRHVLRYLLLPALLPRLFTALRIGTGTALAVLFFAETFFTKYGLGFLIMDGWMRIAYAEMFAGIVAMGLLGLALFGAIDLLERRFCRWTLGPRRGA